MTRLVTVQRTTSAARPILIVTNIWPTEADPTYGIMVQRQVDSLTKLGLSFEILYLRGKDSPLAYLVGAARLAMLNLRRRRYRLVHTHGGESLLAARFYMRAPVLVSFMGGDLLGATAEDGSLDWRWTLRTRVMRQLSRSASRTITKSAEMETVLPTSVRKRNSVVPNGVDRELFAPIPRAEARERLGWSAGEHVVLFVGRRQVPRKRFALARLACELAKERVPTLRLHVADEVAPADIPVLMSAADCLLHPAASEGSPNAVKEALACNLPVVATAAGDIPLLLKDVQMSYICEATTKALSGSLVECLLNGSRSNGRDATEWLSDDRIAATICHIYDRLNPDHDPSTPSQ